MEINGPVSFHRDLRRVEEKTGDGSGEVLSKYEDGWWRSRLECKEFGRYVRSRSFSIFLGEGWCGKLVCFDRMNFELVFQICNKASRYFLYISFDLFSLVHRRISPHPPCTSLIAAQAKTPLPP